MSVDGFVLLTTLCRVFTHRGKAFLSCLLAGSPPHCIFALVDLSEVNILSALQNGNREALEKMFRTWYKPLCAHAYSFLSSRDEAEEAVQHVFIQLWEKRSALQIETSLKAYLYRAVRNHCLNVLDHERVKRDYQSYSKSRPEELAPEASHATLHSELVIKVEEAMNRLPEQCRIIFRMSRFEELKYSEIAEKLGISAKTVENQMGKALRIMREELRDYLPLIVFLLHDLLRNS